MKKLLLFLFLLCNIGLFAQSESKKSGKPKPKEKPKAEKALIVVEPSPKSTETYTPKPEEQATQIFNTGIIFHSPYELTDTNIITKEVVTYGKVVQVSAKTSREGKQMYFINLEKKYPDNLITIMAFKDSYESDYNKIKELLGKTILISGKVEINENYKQEGVGLKPSISIYSKKQIRIISDF